MLEKVKQRTKNRRLSLVYTGTPSDDLNLGGRQASCLGKVK